MSLWRAARNLLSSGIRARVSSMNTQAPKGGFGASWKRVALLASLPLVFLSYDRPFAVWELLHPNLPYRPLPEFHVERPQVEQKLSAAMNQPEFVLVDGLPGSGKTTSVLNAARERGSGVCYLKLSSLGLRGLQEQLSKKFEAPLSFALTNTSLSSKLNHLAAECKRWSGKHLVVIIDKADQLTPEEARELVSIGKEAEDDNLFSLWLVSSTDQWKLTWIRGTDLRRIELPRATTAQLADMVKGMLGDLCSVELANAVAYFSGYNFIDLLRLTEAVKANRIMVEMRDMEPVRFNSFDKELWNLLFAAGDNGVEKSEALSLLSRANYKNCIEVSGSKIKARSAVCRDVYKSFFTMLEAEDAASVLAHAQDAAQTARSSCWFPWLCLGAMPAERQVAAAKKQHAAKVEACRKASHVAQMEDFLFGAVAEYHAAKKQQLDQSRI